MLDTTKACGSSPTWTCFLLTRVFVLFLAVVRLLIFVGLVPGARFFEGSAFFQVAVIPRLETAKPGNSIPIETCFFASWKFSADNCLSAYFVGLIPLKRIFEYSVFFLSFRKLLV